MTPRWRTFLAGLLLFSVHAGAVCAQESESAAPPVIFMPPAVGAPADRVGASTRQAAEGEVAAMEVLAPVGGGYTLRESPVLYWRVSGPLEGSLRIELRDHESGESVLIAFRNDAVFDGLDSLDLQAHGVSLDSRRLYVWSITFLAQDGSRLTARSFIERVEFSGGIMGSIKQDDPASLAGFGIWYDALDLLARRVSQDGVGEEVLETYLASGMK